MPDWNPPPHVVFDPDAAAEAIDETAHALAVVDALIAAEEQAASSARVEWHGTVRDHTDQWLQVHGWAMQHSVDRLQALLRDLHAAVDEAAAAQARRARLVEQWSAERAQELAEARLRDDEPVTGGR